MPDLLGSGFSRAAPRVGAGTSPSLSVVLHAHRQTSLGPALPCVRGFGLQEGAVVTVAQAGSCPGAGVAVLRDRGAGLRCFLSFISPGDNYQSTQWRTARGFLVWSAWLMPAAAVGPPHSPSQFCPDRTVVTAGPKAQGLPTKGRPAAGQCPGLPVGRARFPEPIVSVHAAACSHTDFPFHSQWTVLKEAGRW